MMSIAATISQSISNHFHTAIAHEWSHSTTFRADRKFKSLNNAQLEVKDLKISIQGNPILKGVDIRIPRNKVTCIIGPSGCGKSTLLRTFNRFIDGTEGVEINGSVTLGDINVTGARGKEITELRRNIGLVPQRPCPLPMSIYDNVAYGCRIHGIRNRHQLNAVVRHYLQAVGLWDEVKDRLHDSPAALSGGQQQRLCLARSLAVEPSVILADEATSALDPISSKKVEGLFTELKDRYTIVMVTHTLRQALRIADYVVFMYEGKVIEAGSAQQVFHNPQHQLTRDYLNGAFS
ncbi:MAG: phosphate ABC transporter ATP-binding protein [Prevotellaceae bacterium]|nr:phosphate ABC transporter ATP-binding protein [Prevotellaceae bacterium]